MKCGELGFMTVEGRPCSQNVPKGSTGCLWHSRTPEERSLLAAKAGLAAKMRKALPASYTVKPFDSIESIVEWAHEMAGKVLREDIDYRRTAEARGFATLALSAINARTQQQLVDALLRLEHGGAAFAFLSRLQDGLTESRRRSVSGRVLAKRLDAPEGAAS